MRKSFLPLAEESEMRIDTNNVIRKQRSSIDIVPHTSTAAIGRQAMREDAREDDSEAFVGP